MVRALGKREKAILFLCVTLVSVYAFTAGVVAPFSNRLNFVDGQITSSLRQLRKNQQLLAWAKRLKPRCDLYREKFGQPSVDEEVFTDMIARIETAASQVNIKISNLKPQKTQNMDHYKLFSVSLVILAPLNDFLSFMDALQRDPFYFGVGEMTVERLSYDDSRDLSFRLALTRLTMKNF